MKVDHFFNTLKKREMYLCIHKSIYIYMYKYINIGDLPFSTWDHGSPVQTIVFFSCRSQRGTVTVNKHREKNFKQTKH